MIRIRALNEEDSTESEEEREDDVPWKPVQEIQEEEALSLYNRALTLLVNSKPKESAEAFEEVLHGPYLNPNGEGANNYSTTQRQVWLGCLKTLGKIYSSQKLNYGAAVQAFSKAAAFEPMNVTLWYRLGLVEVKRVNYRSAFNAFLQGYKASPGHWGCIENLVTMAYCSHDLWSCLEYCAVGLKRDSGFVRGLVLRDHIYELNPFMKTSVEKKDPESIFVYLSISDYAYDTSWKKKYLTEIQQLMCAEVRNNEILLEEETKQANKILICPVTFETYTFAELCSVTAKFHRTVLTFGTPLRPILMWKDSTNPQESIGPTVRKSSVGEEELDTNEDASISSTIRRSSSDEKDSTNAMGNVDLPEVAGTGTAENTCDTSCEGFKRVENGNCQESEGTDKDKENIEIPKKKSKKGIKWWQLEGKRRSQRVKGHLLPSPHKTSSKENRFLDRLNSIVPASLLSEVPDNNDLFTDHSSPEKAKTALQLSIDAYFGTQKEVADVKSFLMEYGSTDITTVVIRLMQVLAEKTSFEWPAELATEYVSFYKLYRSHVVQPNIFPEDEEEDINDLRSDTLITLTMLELVLDKTPASSIVELYEDVFFSTALNILKYAVVSLGDRTLSLRLDWLLAKYYLLLSNTCGFSLSFRSALYNLDAIERDLHTEPVTIRIATRLDHTICMEEVKKKLNFVNRLKNVNRIQELYKAKEFEDLIDILNFSLSSEDTTSTDFTNRYYLAESYFEVKKFTDCLEQCLKIINNVSSGKSRNEVILTKTLALVEDICVLKYKSKDYILSMKSRKSVAQAMFKFLIFNEKEIKLSSLTNKLRMKGCTIPWCILHNILYQMEFHESALYLDDEAVPNSILLLQFAHECISVSPHHCLMDNGKLLFYTLEELVHLKSIQGIHFDYEDTKHCIEQSIFCLYGHPSRKSKLKYLYDHNTAAGLSLEWDKCIYLYEYFKPADIHDFDSFKSISADVEGLFQRILSVMPDDVKPSEAYENIKSYLDGKVEEDQFTEKVVEFPSNYYDIFYLIGDHHFKAKEWTKAIEHYAWDLAVITGNRFDSWAAIALAKGEMINFRLNSCDNFTSDEIVSNANTVVNCFRRALRLEPNNTKIKIEFGSFAYAMHSFCSRMLKQNADVLSMDRFAMIESKKDEFLASAAKSFESMAAKVNNEAHNDDPTLATSQQEEERWIHHYMLGKILEKLDPNDADRFLVQYEMAGERLHQQGASYPAKISFYNPPELSVEALEIYYRIHASVLNYIEKHDYSAGMDKILTKYLLAAASSPFMKLKTIRGGETTESRRKKEMQDTADIASTVEFILEGVENTIREDEKQESVREANVESSDDSITSITIESSDSSIEVEYSSFPTPVVSYGLSTFKEKMRQKEVRPRGVKTSSVAEKTAAKTDSPSVVNREQKFPESSVFTNINSYFKDHKYGHLISQCVTALEECISRFPAHHKSFYRLSYTYSVFTNAKFNNKICKEWLLGCGPLDKKKICGLFSDRKPNNFFNCVWRNPIDDIDRPGSFPYHMSKTISHLLTILETLNDHEMLAEIAIQLSKVPDTDKKYLYNSEREQYSQQAFTSCVSAARRFLHENKHRIQDAAMSVFTSYVKLQKLNPKENILAGVLLETYKLHLESKGVNLPNLTIDQAFRFYQHMAWTVKMQNGKGSSGAGKSVLTISNPSSENGAVKSGIAQLTTGIETSQTRNGSMPKPPQWNQQRGKPIIGSKATISVVSDNSYPASGNKFIETARSDISYLNTSEDPNRPDLSCKSFTEKYHIPNDTQITQCRKRTQAKQATMPTDLSKKHTDAVVAIQAALKVNKPKTSGKVQEVVPPRPTLTGASQSPWMVPYIVESPVIYSNPSCSFSTSTNTTNAVGLPKIISNPTFENMSAAPTDVNFNRTQQSVQSSYKPTQKLKRRISAPSNSPDPKKMHLSPAPTNSFRKPPATPTNVRKSILQDSPPSPPVSMPSGSYKIFSFNTSPYKARETVMSQPDWSLRHLDRSSELTLNPPVAHSQSVTSSSFWSSRVDTSDSPAVEIIDLTTKSPEKYKPVNPLEIDSPEKMEVKRLTRGTPEITLVSLESVLSKPLYPLPPKKKHTQASSYLADHY